MQTDYDVLIMGGGMVGAALACALRDTPLRVAVAERAAPELEWPAESLAVRVSAITRASQRIFQHLDAWPRMRARRVSPYQEMFVWDAGGNGSIRFTAADLGEPDLGHIIENRVIQAALWEGLDDVANVERICPASLAAMQLHDDHAEVRLDDGRSLRVGLVVGADGANSKVLELAGISVAGWLYDQHALVANVRTELPHRDTAWQRFLPDGPLAFLPVNDGRCSLVWSCSPEQAQARLAMDEAEFREALGEAFQFRLGGITEVEGRAVHPLRLRHAERYVQPRIALVGDAAHSIHPLAGQGVNIGLLDAAALADVILQAHGRGQDVGAYGVLRRYERWRKGENLLMMGAMDAFKRAFGSGLAPLRLARNLGLEVAGRLGPLKNAIMRRALGLSGDLPPLAR